MPGYFSIRLQDPAGDGLSQGFTWYILPGEISMNDGFAVVVFFERSQSLHLSMNNTVLRCRDARRWRQRSEEVFKNARITVVRHQLNTQLRFCIRGHNNCAIGIGIFGKGIGVVSQFVPDLLPAPGDVRFVRIHDDADDFGAVRIRRFDQGIQTFEHADVVAAFVDSEGFRNFMHLT